MTDPQLAYARELHRRAEYYERLAGESREARNILIRKLREEKVPNRAIAAALGCSAELISHIVQRRVGPGTRSRRPRELT